MLTRLTLCFALFASAANANGYTVGDTFEDPMVLATEVLDRYLAEEEGNPGVEVDVSTDFFGNMTILVAETGFADDSVRGVRNQYVLEPGEDGVWTLIYMHQQQLCYRGVNTVTWQDGLCA